MREEAIKLAVGQLQAGGYKNLSFGSIAEALGTTRANLHHHFRNKEGLGIEATKAYLVEEKGAVDLILAKHDGDLRAILRALELHLIDLVASSDVANPCVMSQILNDADAPEAMRNLVLARCDEEQMSIQKQIAASRGTHSLPAGRSDENLAYAVMAAMFGIMQMGFISRDSDSIRKNVTGVLTGMLP